VIVLIVPSRGRPKRAAAMVASVRATASEPVRIVVAVDEDDETLPQYHELLPTDVLIVAHQGYTGTLNAVGSAAWDHYTILGAFGDDVLFRTPGWDLMVEAELATPGIAYGDDLIHGKNHPSAVFMSSVIAKALGWLALPATSHQWADDGWKRLGQEAGCLRFIPEVIVEHMHPAVGKGEWDATYASVFTDERAKSDFDGFTAWVENGGLAADAAKVRAVL
jgi:hypothetical protein